MERWSFNVPIGLILLWYVRIGLALSLPLTAVAVWYIPATYVRVRYRSWAFAVRCALYMVAVWPAALWQIVTTLPEYEEARRHNKAFREKRGTPPVER